VISFSRAWFGRIALAGSSLSAEAPIRAAAALRVARGRALDEGTEGRLLRKEAAAFSGFRFSIPRMHCA
jgi:hypothetical protein